MLGKTVKGRFLLPLRSVVVRNIRQFALRKPSLFQKLRTDWCFVLFGNLSNKTCSACFSLGMFWRFRLISFINKFQNRYVVRITLSWWWYCCFTSDWFENNFYSVRVTFSEHVTRPTCADVPLTDAENSALKYTGSNYKFCSGVFTLSALGIYG